MSTCSSRGGLRCCQVASHATRRSSRPRLPGGLVSCASRCATAAALALSPPGRLAHSARSSAIDLNMITVEYGVWPRLSSARRAPRTGAGEMAARGKQNVADDLLVAITFCTRLPLGGVLRAERYDLARASWAMPVAGAIVGGAGALGYWGAFKLGLTSFSASA